jgi:hypothetical protein
MLIYSSQKRLDQDAQYRAHSSEAQTTAIDQTAGLVILTTVLCRFVFRPGPVNEVAGLPQSLLRPIG